MIKSSPVGGPAEAAGEFSSPGSTFCADSYVGIHSIRVIQQKQHVQDPGHSARSVGGKLQLNTHIPYTYVALNEVTL